MNTIQKLNATENKVLIELADGKPDKVIAKLLGLSHRTINNTVSHLLYKFRAKNRTELAIKYYRLRGNDEEA